MKKSTFIILLSAFFFVQNMYAQKGKITDAQLSLQAGKVLDAKKSIDEALQSEEIQKRSDAWNTKGDVNKNIYESKIYYAQNPNCLFDAKEAYIITLTENFLRENVHPDIFGEFPFLLAEIVPPKELSQNNFQEFDTLYKQLLNEFNNDSEYKNKILGNLFGVLLLKIKEKFWLNYNPIEEGNRNSQIVKSFKQLLESEFRKVLKNEQNETKLRVQDFAESLNMHPNYLNSVIKSKTGRTVNEWISKRTLSVAKSLLMSTPYSSKEIAYKLGFSEPTHFSRFFKKHTQLSPGSFRKSNQ